MKTSAIRYFSSGLALIAASLVSFGAMAGGTLPYVDCPYYTPTWLACNEKAQFSGFYGPDYECTVKVDCDADPGESISGSVGISFGQTYGAGLPCYRAQWGFEEDGLATCSSYGMSVNLEDSPETKVVCENDTEVTFKVKCPHEVE